MVLRVRLLTETSLIVHWLTEEAGRVATVARGARRPRSPLRGKLDLFHEGDFVFRRSRRSDLHTLGEFVLRETHPGLRTDWRRLAQASYAVNLIEQTTEADTPLPEAWDLFRDFVSHVERAAPGVASVLALELKWLEVLGLAPDLEEVSFGGRTREVARALRAADWEGVAGLEAGVEKAGWTPLIRFLHGFLIHHLGRLPRGRGDVLALLSAG